MNKDCTLFLSTYDNGEDLWEGFFKALKYQWPEMDMKIVMNTEKKTYSFIDYDIKVVNSIKNDMTWSERLINALKQVETEYVLFFLEDFWLAEKVDDAFFRKTLEWMKENPDVANFSYYPCLPGTNIDDERFDRFELRPDKCEYKYNCQVGLWRTKEFISFFRPHESPWDWEIYGSMRAARNKQKFYVLKENTKNIFYYGDNLKGCIVHRGKWVKEEVLPLAELYGLQIDYSIRGFEDFEEIKREANRTLFEKITQKHALKKAIIVIKKDLKNLKTKWLSTKK